MNWKMLTLGIAALGLTASFPVRNQDDALLEGYLEFTRTPEYWESAVRGMSNYNEEVIAYRKAREIGSEYNVSNESLLSLLEEAEDMPIDAAADPLMGRRLLGVYFSGLMANVPEERLLAFPEVPENVMWFGAFLERGNVEVGTNAGAETFYKAPGYGYVIHVNTGECAFWGTDLRGGNKMIVAQRSNGGFHDERNIRVDGEMAGICLRCDETFRSAHLLER